MNNKTYYDWLEVSPKASPEVIEKAYKALVKKYHPDLQENKNTQSEELIKKINEAYDVLSDKEKRNAYDERLLAEEHERIQIQQNQMRQHHNNTSNIQHQNQNHPTQEELELNYKQQVEAARQQAYYDAYVQDMRNRGYKFKQKKSFKDYLKTVIIILIIFASIWLIWQIPPVRNWINNLAKNNFIIKIIVDIIKGIYEALYETIF